VAWYRSSRDERERSYRDKQRQRALLTAAGVAGVAGGLARAPWAAKHAVRAAGKLSPRVGRGMARIPANTRTRLADIENKATRASVPLAIGSGATGSASSLIYAGRLKRETKKEGQKLGLEPASKSLSQIAKADDRWRSHVSPEAIKAHDETLPGYQRRSARDVAANAALTGVGGAGAVKGYKAYTSGASRLMARTPGGVPRMAAGLGLSGLAGLAIGHGATGAVDHVGRIKDNQTRRAKIRARGHERRRSS
jgi:hypothetical protein